LEVDLAFLYELAVLGTPSSAQINELEQLIAAALLPFGLELRREVAWHVCPGEFKPDQRRTAGVVFFGGKVPDSSSQANIKSLLRNAIPILPVVSDITKVNEEIPLELKHLNCLAYNIAGAQRVAHALLECADLLPRQRRIFLSYRRDEAREAAMQLFDALSSRHFDVFLDTYSIVPAVDFQTMLWHHLCDSDVLVMLDTPNYFTSRWTSAEFGRALAKGISVLSIGWPDFTPSVRTATASRVELISDEINHVTGKLADEAIMRICSQLEIVRSQSLAVRNLNLVSNLRIAVERIGGNVIGVGLNKAIYVQLADGRDVVVYPTVSVPTSMTLHNATSNAPGKTVAVIYDHVGLHSSWLEHLDWLGCHIKTARWVKASEAAWQFADWEASS